MPETTQNLANSGTILPVKGPKKSLIDSFNRTNLDTENSEPSGGPINDPTVVIDGMVQGSGFSQTYSSTNPYYQNSPDNQSSVLYQEGAETGAGGDSLKVTALDVESNEAGVRQGGSGGPNRTNSSNIPTGQYKAVGSSPFPLSPTPGGAPLKTREGQDKEFTVNAYTPQNTYMQAMVKFRDEAKNELI